MPLCTPPIHLICYMYVPIAFVYCGGVTCACTCPKRRNISIAIQDTCTLSSSVNKCITICTPSIHLVVRLANPITYLVSDAGTINGYRVATIPLIRSQVVAFAIHPTDRSSSCYVLRHSYGISLYLKLAREHSIQHSI